MYVDLAAEKLFAAEKDSRRIAVEVKSFVGASELEDLYNAIGQFILYRLALGLQEPDRELYLAIRRDIYTRIFDDPTGELLCKTERIKLLVFEPVQQEVVQWIP